MIKFTKGGLFERLLTVYGMQKDLSNLCNIVKATLLAIVVITMIISIASATVVIDTQIICKLLTGELLFSWDTIEAAYGVVALGLLLAFCFVSVALQGLIIFALVVSGLAMLATITQEWLEENPDKPAINSIKEVYRSIKDKYCPSVTWVSKEDK